MKNYFNLDSLERKLTVIKNLEANSIAIGDYDSAFKFNCMQVPLILASNAEKTLLHH